MENVASVASVIAVAAEVPLVWAFALLFRFGRPLGPADSGGAVREPRQELLAAPQGRRHIERIA